MSRWSWLVVLVAVVVFSPLLAAGFVWDDNLLVVQNTLTHSLANLPALFTTDLWSSTPAPDPEAPYYRPLVLLSLAIDRAVAGLSPAWYHLHSLAWHLASVVLVGRLLQRIGLQGAAVACGMALFALHPVQVEPVAFISARNDPMATTLLLVALLALARDAPRPRQLLGGGLAILAAALCKESVLVAPALLALVEWARTGRLGRLSAHLALLAGLGAVALLRAALHLGLPGGAGLERMLAALPGVVGIYAERLVLPVGMLPGAHLAWPQPVSWPALAGLLVGLVAMLALGGRRAVAGLLFAGLTAAPALAAIAHVGAVPDRYLYLPLVGIAMMVGAAASRAPRPAMPLAALVLVLGLLSAAAVPHWRDDLTLWSAAAQRWPTAYTAGIYAKVLQDEGQLDEAARWYHRATSPPRPFAESCYNATAVHIQRGDPVAAIQAGDHALAAGCPPSAELVAPQALALAITGQWARAEAVALTLGEDPTGYGAAVRVAARIRRGEAPLAGEQGDSETLLARAQQLLVWAGE